MKMDWQSKEIWILLIGLTMTSFVIIGIFVFLLYKFKLIIPKSKLHDEGYIQQSIKRIKAIRRTFFILHILQMITLAGCMMLQYRQKIDFLSPRFIYWTIGFILLFFISMPFGFVGKRPYTRLKDYLNANDVRYVIGLKRSLFQRMK